MRIILLITAFLAVAFGVFWLLVSLFAILTPGGCTNIASVASACFLLALVAVVAEISLKLENIYQLLQQPAEKDKK